MQKKTIVPLLSVLCIYLCSCAHTVNIYHDKPGIPESRSTVSASQKTETKEEKEFQKEVFPEFTVIDFATGMGTCSFPHDQIGACDFSNIARRNARTNANEKLSQKLNLESGNAFYRDQSFEIYNTNVTQNINNEKYQDYFIVKNDGQIQNRILYRDVGWDDNEFEVKAFLIDIRTIPTNYLYFFGYGCPMNSDENTGSRIDIARGDAKSDALSQAANFSVGLMLDQYTDSVKNINKSKDEIKYLCENMKQISASIEAKFNNVQGRVFSKRRHIGEGKYLTPRVDFFEELRKWGIDEDEFDTLGENNNSGEYKIILAIPVADIQNIVSEEVVSIK